MWSLEYLVTLEGTTKIERAAAELAKAVRDFSTEPTRGNLEIVRSAIDKAETSVVGFEEYDFREFFTAAKQLMSVYGRRAVHFLNNPNFATRERAAVFVQAVADIAGHIFRELDAINKPASG
jgi:hypothetical protein